MAHDQNPAVIDLETVRYDAQSKLIPHSKLHDKPLNPIVLFLPATLEDALSPEMENIIKIVKEAEWLDSVIVGLDRANKEEEYKAVKNLVGDDIVVIWNNSPEMEKLRETMKSEGANIIPGKGLNIWTGLLYWYAQRKDPMPHFMLHDCDIKTYNKQFIERI